MDNLRNIPLYNCISQKGPGNNVTLSPAPLKAFLSAANSPPGAWLFSAPQASLHRFWKGTHVAGRPSALRTRLPHAWMPSRREPLLTSNPAHWSSTVSFTHTHSAAGLPCRAMTHAQPRSITLDSRGLTCFPSTDQRRLGNGAPASLLSCVSVLLRLKVTVRLGRTTQVFSKEKNLEQVLPPWGVGERYQSLYVHVPPPPKS